MVVVSRLNVTMTAFCMCVTVTGSSEWRTSGWSTTVSQSGMHLDINVLLLSVVLVLYCLILINIFLLQSVVFYRYTTLSFHQCHWIRQIFYTSYCLNATQPNMSSRKMLNFLILSVSNMLCKVVKMSWTNCGLSIWWYSWFNVLAICCTRFVQYIIDEHCKIIIRILRIQCGHVIYNRKKSDQDV